ncbi:MAG: hypothetical protein ABIF09_02920 [Gemmatimonadota bacterium]
MASNKNRLGIRRGMVALSLVGLSGCMEYTIETTLNPDGSGHRAVNVEVTDAHRLTEGVSRQEFVDLWSFSEEKGWDHHVELQNNGDTTNVFTRETRIDDLSSWSRLNDELHIHGTRPFTADSTIGHVTLGDVHFRNRVRVRSSGGTDGSVAFSYQESFTWENGLDAFIEGILMEMERSVQRSYPDLSDRDRGEIIGAARAGLWSAVEEGVLDTSSEEEDRLWNQALDRITTSSIKIVRAKNPNASEEALRKRLDLFSDDFEGGDPTERLDYLLPGMSQAGGEVIFRLTMPGRVTTTNAHEREGNILIWEFNTDDALSAPVVLVAESVVGG